MPPPRGLSSFPRLPTLPASRSLASGWANLWSRLTALGRSVNPRFRKRDYQRLPSAYALGSIISRLQCSVPFRMTEVNDPVTARLKSCSDTCVVSGDFFRTL